MNDEYWMQHALGLAKKAEQAGEVPVGAVIVLNDELVAEGWNRPISSADPTAHAEIIALRAAGQKLDNYRLLDTELYVTLEPCPMCAGAMIQARLTRLVYGAKDQKFGADGSVVQVMRAEGFNHRTAVTGGVLEAEAIALLQQFFQKLRQRN